MLCLIYYREPRKCSMRCVTSVVFDLLQCVQEVFNEVSN